MQHSAIARMELGHTVNDKRHLKIAFHSDTKSCSESPDLPSPRFMAPLQLIRKVWPHETRYIVFAMCKDQHVLFLDYLYTNYNRGQFSSVYFRLC